MVIRFMTCALAAALSATLARADEVQLLPPPGISNGFDPIPVTAWRFGALELRDPHVYYSRGVCVDVTDELDA